MVSVIVNRRKDKEIKELEETCAELESETKKGQSIVAKLLLVVSKRTKIFCLKLFYLNNINMVSQCT